MHISLSTHLAISLGARLTKAIHDPLTFFITLTLGILQMVVAVYGGILAVAALPPEKKRPPHVAAFVLLGIGLFLVTFYVGFINDRSQFKATNDNNEIKGDLNNNQTALNTALRGLYTLNGAFTGWTTANSKTASCNSAKAPEIAEFRRYAGEVVALAKAQTQSPNLANASSPTLAPAYSPQVQSYKPNLLPAQAPDQASTLHTDIQRMLSYLKSADQTNTRTVTDLVGQYLKHNSFQQSMDQFYNGVALSLKTRDDAYARLQPQIGQLRLDIQKVL